MVNVGCTGQDRRRVLSPLQLKQQNDKFHFLVYVVGERSGSFDVSDTGEEPCDAAGASSSAPCASGGGGGDGMCVSSRDSSCARSLFSTGREACMVGMQRCVDG